MAKKLSNLIKEASIMDKDMTAVLKEMTVTAKNMMTIAEGFKSLTSFAETNSVLEKKLSVMTDKNEVLWDRIVRDKKKIAALEETIKELRAKEAPEAGLIIDTNVEAEDKSTIVIKTETIEN